ncbi:MAG: carbohydrate porin [Bacteroidetes bacterium]|nr:carbohydrate porin [Bacteroidota bacterium]
MKIAFPGVMAVLLVGMPLLAQPEASAQRDKVSFESSYLGDFVNNISGGARRGATYLGLANVRVTVPLSAFGLWSGGEIFANAASTHGARPSAGFIGDFQVVSNIEAGDHTYLQELWYRHTWESTAITIGLQDFNAQFASNEHANLFLNSSFGLPSTISANVPAPMFPLTSLGITAAWNITSELALLAAVFDGRPTDFEDNAFNLRWHLGPDDGIFAAAELQYATDALFSLPGSFKAGVYNHDFRVAFNVETNRNETVYTNNYGVYATIDQTVWADGSGRSLALFARGSVSPNKCNTNTKFTGAGLGYYGLLWSQGEDMLGLGWVHAGMRDGEDEMTIELTYYGPLTDHFFIQPDVQYVLNPVGTGKALPSCLVGTIRFGVSM